MRSAFVRTAGLPGSTWLRILLWPASLLYGSAVIGRGWLYREKILKQKRLKSAVISIGNLTVGGTGKTPMVIWLAEKLLAQDCRVAILSRGYRGTGSSSDEVELMRSRLQNRVPFGVGKNRFEEGHRLESRQAIDVFILDDGFQHLQLARDLDIVLLDASNALSKQSLLPTGPLREFPSALARAGAIIFTRSENSTGVKEAIQRMGKLPVYAASTKLLGFRQLGGSELLHTAGEMGAGPFFAFCGIGNPRAFVRDLERWGFSTCGQMFFADHHEYSSADLQAIEFAAAECGANALVTTEKDSWNLRKATFPTMPVYLAIIDMEITNDADLLTMVRDVIKRRGLQHRGAA